MLAIRNTSRKLVALDNELGGVPIAEAAAHAFRVVHRRLGAGDYGSHERDVRSAAAELAEVAGWALFDAERHEAARRFNQEALLLAQLSGDRSIELLILQNMAMHAGWLDRPREELAIARSVLGRSRLSPRVEAIFATREARGLFASGVESDARRAFDRARSLLGEGESAGDPEWAWWITESEISGHYGYVLREYGHQKEAVSRLEDARRWVDGVRAGISAAHLLGAYLNLGAWRDAVELTESIIPSVPEISSARALTLLDRAAERGRQTSNAPSGLRDALHHLRVAVGEAPYRI